MIYYRKKRLLKNKNRGCTRNHQYCKERKQIRTKEKTWAYEEVLDILKMGPKYDMGDLEYIPVTRN